MQAGGCPFAWQGALRTPRHPDGLAIRPTRRHNDCTLAAQ
jgi:hypothetical protein